MTPIRILVADDNEDHRFFITRSLRQSTSRDLAIDTVRDGQEALAYLRREGEHTGREMPHLLILDLKMPRMDGHEVIAEVRKDERLAALPIAVLSSSDRDEDVQKAYRAGGNTYVIKEAADGRLADELACLREFWTEVAVLPDPAA